MRQKNVKKKTVSLLLAAAMILTSFPVLGKEAQAAGTSDRSLSVKAFATKEQLMSAFAPDGNGSSSATGKIAFGKNSTSAVQEWYILEKDNGVTGDNTILFAAGPIATNQKFDASTATKSYDADWGCAYTDNAPTEVNGNHYGGSDLRAKMKEIAGNVQYFTTAEQDLMNDTIVTTFDTNANAVYTTTDKLYALNTEGNGSTTIKAGTNDQIVLAMSTYWSNGNNLWLRAPDTSHSDIARVAVPGAYVHSPNVSNVYALVPAFNLNLSSVIFASAAKAASSGNAENGTIADGTAMTLRLDGSDKTIGTVVYDDTAGKIAAQKDAGAAGTVSLVVQGSDGSKDWYYSVAAEGATVVTKEQIQTACGISGDISLADCKIWLETTIDNVAYAKMAEAKSLNAEVTLKPGETTLRADETISNSTDGTVTVDKGHDGTVDTTIKLPTAGNIHITKDGRITVPAGGKIQSGDGKELTLPGGGSVDTDGKVEADKIVSGDTTVTAPTGGKVTADKDGNITVPAGGKVETGDGKELTLPNGGTVDKDGTVSEKNPPATVPAGGKVETESGKELTLPNGGTVDEDGNVEADKIKNGETTVTAPESGKVTADKDGNITVPTGGKVETESGGELTLPNGGTVDKDETVEADKIISGDTTVTAPEGGKVTADKDGNITVPAGGKVETGAGKELTLPEGGTVDKDETVEADKIISGDTTVTASEGGSVTADKDGNITVPAGGKVQTGAGKEQTLPNGGTVDKDGTVSANQTQPTNPPTNPPTENPSVTVPAGGKVETESGKELILPNGGTVDEDSNVEADKIISGDTTVTAPEGGKVTADKDGNITVPAGGKVETGDGKEMTLPEGGTVDKDETVEADKIISGDTTVTAPEGGKVTADKDGNITVPAGGKVQTGDGKEQTLSNGGTVDKDGNVSENQQPPTNPPTGTPTNPPTGTPTEKPAFTVPAGGKVETESGKELTLPNGGTVDENGNVEADKIKSGETTVTAPEGGKLTADKAGTITVPAGGKVENGGGKELILPNGGTVDKDETVEADRIISGDTTVTAPEGGKVTADKTGTITVPAGGTVQTGDEDAKTLPNGGTVDKDGTVSANSAQPTNPPATEPTEKPTETPVPPADETISPEEVMKNSEKLDAGVTVKWKGNTFKLSWKAVQGAEGYDIFAAWCQKELNKKSPAKTVKGKKTSVSLTKIGGKKLSGKKNYKFKIKAWKQIDGKKVYIGTSKTYHVAGGKNKKYTNARKLSPSKKKYTLKKGKSVSLKVRIVKQSKKKLLPKSHGPELRYFSDNKEVATVTSKGKVKAKGKGTCYIYVTALNGISVKIKITVK